MTTPNTVYNECPACLYWPPYHAPGCRLDARDKTTAVEKLVTPSRDWLNDEMLWERTCSQCGCVYKGHFNRLICRQCSGAA